MIKNIVFDLGNVVLKGTPPTIVTQFAQNEEELVFIKETLLKEPEWKLMIVGLISTNESIMNIKNRNETKFHNLIDTAVSGWHKKLEVNEDVVDIARKLKEKNYDIYVLSNMALDTYEYIKNIEFFKMCTGITISAFEHTRKPEPQIFEKFLNKYNLKGDECLFIDDDDTGKNYETARLYGMKGRKVKANSANDIITMLEEYSINLDKTD